jgi:alkylation response protein AidB-like acyl-CoA dehydrogenase
MSDHDIKALSFTREQIKYKRIAEQLVKEHIEPAAARIDREGKFPKEMIRLLGEHDLLGFGIGEEHGGKGGDFMAMTLVLEQLGMGCASTAMIALMHTTTIPYLSAVANEEQRARLIQPLIAGKLLGALSMSEPGTGSRLWHMSSWADASEEGFIINSMKSFVTSAGSADFYIVPVRSTAESAANELNVFWIEGNNPGIHPLGEWDGLGLRGNSSTPIHFKDCFVEKRNLLGEENSGFSLLMAYTLPIYFVGIGAIYLGICEQAYQFALKKVKQRTYTDTNNTSGDIESIQRYIGEMKTKICTLRAAVYRCARLVNHTSKVFDMLKQSDLLQDLLDNAQKDSFFIELAQLKITSTETAAFVTDKALQVCGGQGYKRGNPVERLFRDARAGSLMGPTNDILKVIIGKRELGLPYPWDLISKNEESKTEELVKV